MRIFAQILVIKSAFFFLTLFAEAASKQQPKTKNQQQDFSFGRFVLSKNFDIPKSLREHPERSDGKYVLVIRV